MTHLSRLMMMIIAGGVIADETRHQRRQRWRVGAGSINHSGSGVVLLPLSVVNRLN